ncbi:MAG: glycoside hydrolase family 3 C-terminal domain-containing protein [bacterium]|nr:glycoside hydrolase family 3 C-terminal domain-containing protein [bacterium]
MKAEKEREYRKRAEELMKEMTLEEKVSQIVYTAAQIPRLGIKAYNWWNEALHGVARAGVSTVFPQAIGMAAMFDEEQIAEVAEVISTEARAKFSMQQQYGDYDIYKGLTFWAPNVNIFRDPRWGRGHETFGEDPYLTSRLGVRFIEGMQGEDDNYLKTAACAKHFAVHSGPESKRHFFDAKVSTQDLFETYLPAFESCVREAKVEAVMGAYNRTNGEPCCASETLLQDILRGEWGFQGHVVSDCWAIKDIHENHQVTNSALESAALAMNNGCDLNCGSLFLYMQEAVERGMVKEERLNEAVVNLLTTRLKLGLFEEPDKQPFKEITYKDNDTAEHRKLNEQTAEKTFVLLKNEGELLPLDKKKIHNIGVIGPNADSRRALEGNYEGTASRYVTILEGIEDYVGDEVRVLYSEGCHLYKKKMTNLSQGNDRIAEVRAVCDMSDVVIACLGLDADLEGEEGDTGNEFSSGDKPNLSLPGMQQELLEVICESKKPVILVLLSGSALDLRWANEHVSAIVEGWYPGAQGGNAMARLLFGECCPEGKLPITFYRTSEELPDFDDYSMKGRTYRYMKQEALYPFGYGLSYTKFSLTEPVITRTKIKKGENIEIEAKLTNVGSVAGAETLQVYVGAKREDAPNPQLKGLKKVFLLPGESKTVRVCLEDKAFGLRDEKGDLMLYQGEFSLYVGTQQPDARSEKLTGKKPFCFEVTAEKTECIAERKCK